MIALRVLAGGEAVYGTATVRGGLHENSPAILRVEASVDERATARCELGLTPDEPMEAHNYLREMEFYREDAEELVLAIRDLWPDLLKPAGT